MNYTVYKSKRKSIRMVIKSDGKIYVYCPYGLTNKQIGDFVEAHYEGLKQKYEQIGNTLFGCVGDTLPFLGKNYKIIYNNVEKIFFDGQNFICPSVNKEALRIMYRDFLRKETKKIVSSLVKAYTEKYGFSHGRVSVKSIYSRYGSCSGKKNLNFTLALSAFDMEFIEMVVAHELCHTVHMNHSKDFYNLLSQIIPNHKQIKAQNAAERSMILKSVFFSLRL